MTAAQGELWLRICSVGSPDGLRALNRVAGIFGMFSPEWKGRLLALVREAWSDSDAYAAPHGERLCWRVDIDPDSWGEDHDHPEGKTEAEALVAALEAAP